MTIEFHCPFCQKLLKTPDEKAGVTANCPGCGESLTVPVPQHEAAHADPSFAAVDGAAGPVSAPPVDSPAAEEMRADPEATKLCPMCGAEIRQAAKRCRFCGEDLVEREGDAADGRIEAGNILTRSWEIFQKNVGLLVGSTLALMGIGIITFLIGYVAMIVAVVSIAGPAGPRGGQGPSAAAIATLVSGVILFILLMFAVNAFLQAGYHILMLRIARGERAELGDLFSGSRFFWRLFWGNILFTLMTYAGFALLIVPGFFVILLFWPFSFVIVDQNTGVVEALRKAKDLMTGNLLAVFILGLAAIGINMLGQMACYVGMIFSVPLGSLIFAVAYCRMLRQIPHIREAAP